MAQQTINIGSAPNDGLGDPNRTAFDKANDNFTELYAADVALAADIAALEAGVSGINAQTGTTYSFVLGDSGKLVTLANAAPVAVTIPTNASVAFAVSGRIDVAAMGAGAVTITGDTGVTVNGVSGGSVELDGQYAGASLYKLATNTWLAVGKLV